MKLHGRPPPSLHQAKTGRVPTGSRTTNPDAPQRRGLRTHLRQLQRANSSVTALPRPLQLPTTTRQPRPPTTGRETDQDVFLRLVHVIPHKG